MVFLMINRKKEWSHHYQNLKHIDIYFIEIYKKSNVSSSLQFL